MNQKLACILIVIPMALASSHSKAQDLITTNRSSLQQFWAAAETANRPVSILSFGDSMADSYRSVSYVLMNRMVARLGIAGYSMLNYQNAMMYRLEGNAALVPPGPFWFTTHYQLPTGSAVSWEKQYSAGGVNSDRAGVFYVSHSGGGNFNLMISSNGGPWTIASSISAQSPSPQGHFVKVDLPLGLHRVRVESISGMNYILGPQLLDRTSNGVHAIFTYEGGILLSQVTNVPLAIRQPVFQELAPDLLIWHMKEDGGATTAAGLQECEQWWQNATPHTNVLYIGTPWIGLDSTSPATIDQNTLLRSTALANTRAYVDCMTPAVSYPWMNERGYMDDATHVSLLGSTYLAGIAWNDLHFFLLRRSRTLSASPNGGHLTLNYPTSPGVNYILEHSLECSNWATLSSDIGTGTSLTRSIPMQQTKEFFRLRLEPVP